MAARPLRRLAALLPRLEIAARWQPGSNCPTRAKEAAGSARGARAGSQPARASLSQYGTEGALTVSLVLGVAAYGGRSTIANWSPRGCRSPVAQLIARGVPEGPQVARTLAGSRMPRKPPDSPGGANSNGWSRKPWPRAGNRLQEHAPSFIAQRPADLRRVPYFGTSIWTCSPIFREPSVSSRQPSRLMSVTTTGSSRRRYRSAMS